MRKLALLLTLLTLAVLGIAACGDDDDEDTTSAETTEATSAETTAGGGGEGGAVSITANPDGELAYEETSVTVPAGEVTIEFDNPASIGHDVIVEDDGGNELIATDVITGETTTASGTLDPGEYTFYCSVAGHREAGMEGTLTAE